MADTVTSFLGLTKPEVGASSNTWGDKINSDLDILDLFASNALAWNRALGSSENLNNILDYGVYPQNTTAGATSGTNYPVAIAGCLIVIPGKSANNTAIQLYSEYTGARLWYRHCRGGTTWSAWRAFAYTTDLDNIPVVTTSVNGLMAAVDKVKLNGIDAGAQVNLPVGTGPGTVCAGNDSRLSDSREWTAAVISQAEAEAGTATTPRKFTAQRVKQAIEALTPAPPVGLYTGSAVDELVFPVGHYIFATDKVTANRNQTRTIWCGSSGSTDYRQDNGGSPGALSGTWRARGGSGTLGFLYQRVA